MTATDSMQEYLAEAYRIAYYQHDNHYVSTSSLAEELQVSAPAVTRMVQRLPQRFEAVERGASIFATLVSIDPSTRLTTAIERIHIPPA